MAGLAGSHSGPPPPSIRFQLTETVRDKRRQELDAKSARAAALQSQDKTRVASKKTHVASKQTRVASKQTRVASKQTRVAVKKTHVTPKKTRVASKQTRVASKNTTSTTAKRARTPATTFAQARSTPTHDPDPSPPSEGCEPWTNERNRRDVQGSDSADLEQPAGGFFELPAPSDSRSTANGALGDSSGLESATPQDTTGPIAVPPEDSAFQKSLDKFKLKLTEFYTLLEEFDKSRIPNTSEQDDDATMLDAEESFPEPGSEPGPEPEPVRNRGPRRMPDMSEQDGTPTAEPTESFPEPAPVRRRAARGMSARTAVPLSHTAQPVSVLPSSGARFNPPSIRRLLELSPEDLLPKLRSIAPHKFIKLCENYDDHHIAGEFGLQYDSMSTYRSMAIRKQAEVDGRSALAVKDELTAIQRQNGVIRGYHYRGLFESRQGPQTSENSSDEEARVGEKDDGSNGEELGPDSPSCPSFSAQTLEALEAERDEVEEEGMDVDSGFDPQPEVRNDRDFVLLNRHRIALGLRTSSANAAQDSFGAGSAARDSSPEDWIRSSSSQSSTSTDGMSEQLENEDEQDSGSPKLVEQDVEMYNLADDAQENRPPSSEPLQCAASDVSITVEGAERDQRKAATTATFRHNQFHMRALQHLSPRS